MSISFPSSPFDLNHMPSLDLKTHSFASTTLLKLIQSLLSPDVPLGIVCLDFPPTYTVPTQEVDTDPLHARSHWALGVQGMKSDMALP